MKRILTILAALWATALTASVYAQAPTFAVSFDGLTPGTAITTTNTNLTYTRNAGAAPYSSTLTAMASTFDTGGSLHLLSSGYGSTPNIAGVGANYLSSSSVYSLSVDITSDLWQTGTSTYIMMGDWTTGSANQVYNPGNSVTTAGYSLTTIGAQSLFSLAIVGSTALDGGYLRTIKANGSYADIKNSANTNVVLKNGENYSLHIIANGSDSAITVGDDTIAAGSMAIYLDQTLVATAIIADSVDASAFRVVSVGNSTGNLQNSIEVGDITLWNSGVAPIPESAATASLLGALALLTVGVARRRRA